MRFTDPLYLLLLLPLVAGLWLSFRHVHGMAKGRKRFAFVVRFILAGLLIFALAGPESRRPNVGLCTMFLLDRSDSVPDAEKQRAEKFVDEALKQLGKDQQAGVIAFGREPVVDAAPGGRRDLGRVLSQVDGSASDLASAIRLASAGFPDGKGRRIVVLTDGNETSGDAMEAASVSASDGIPIDFVQLGNSGAVAEVSVLDLQAPTEMRTDQPFDIRVLVDSTKEQDAVLALDRDGTLVKETPVHLNAGRTALIVTDKVAGVGFHRYRATIRAKEDLDNRNNVGMGFVSVKGKSKVLVMQENPNSSLLAQALRKSGVDVDLGGPGSLPSRPEEFQSYDAIIFNDFNADSVQPLQMKLIQAAVRDSGVGFAMIGGENSFLPGGYYGTPIADVLPVDLNIRQRKSFPSTSICIMIDVSGSMGMEEDGIPKVRLAAKAASETVKLMSPLDRVGVAGSTDGIEFVAPMQPLVNKEAVIGQIERLQVGGGGIFCKPSVDVGEKTMLAEPSQVKHFIMLADGDDCDMQEGCDAVVARMRAEKITTSCVAIGDGKDVAFLQRLAAIGGGRFYLAKRANQLPAIMTQDAAVMSRSAIEEGVFYPKMVAGEEILRGIDSTPPLRAYDLTDSRPLARIGMKTKKDDPLLAVWQYGLGTSLAFTSDAQARWAQAWIGWEGFPTFWAQALRAIVRRAPLNQYDVKVRDDGARGQIEVKAFDALGNPLTATNAAVRVSTPSGDTREVTLNQQGPGLYTGSFDAAELGSYIVTVAEKDPSGVERVSSTGFSLPYPAEYRTTRPNRPLLARMADQTKGVEESQPSQALRTVPNPGESISELWPLFIFLAALVLPFDVGVRRIALPLKEIFAKAWARLRPTRQKTATQQVVVGRLQQAKQRAQRPTSENHPIPPIVPTSEPDRRPVSPTSTSTSGSASSKLLEAKRKRGQD
ncbi:MAG TPA: VWA domain-containing protein [Fimbriimonadaceae bacterium]|nr:VWA domain-containing protein [Fimbriimonadaceae bacterium]